MEIFKQSYNTNSSALRLRDKLSNWQLPVKLLILYSGSIRANFLKYPTVSLASVLIVEYIIRTWRILWISERNQENDLVCKTASDSIDVSRKVFMIYNHEDHL